MKYIIVLYLFIIVFQLIYFSSLNIQHIIQFKLQYIFILPFYYISVVVFIFYSLKIFDIKKNKIIKALSLFKLVLLLGSIISLFLNEGFSYELLSKIIIGFLFLFLIYKIQIKIYYTNIENAFERNDFINFNKYLKKYFYLTRNKFNYLRFKGKGLMKKGEIKRAIGILREALLIMPNDIFYYNVIAETYRDLAIAYKKTDHIKNALKINLKALRFYKRSENKEKRDIKNYINTLLSICDIYYENQKYADAKKYLNKIFKIENDNYKALYYLAVIKFKEGNIKEAERLILKILSRDSNYTIDLYYWLIRIYLEQNNEIKLYRCLLKATRREHSFFLKYHWPDDIFNKKIIHRYLNFVKRELAKHETKTLYNTIIYLSLKTQNLHNAKKMLKKMEKKITEDKNIYYWRIILNVKENNFKQARRLYKNTIKKWPNFINEFDWQEVSCDLDEIRKLFVDNCK